MNENMFEIPNDIEQAEKKARELWQGYLEADKLLATQFASGGPYRFDADKIFLICLAAREYAKKSAAQELKGKVQALEEVVKTREQLENTYKNLYGESEKDLAGALAKIEQLQGDRLFLEQAIDTLRNDKRALMRTIEIQVIGE